MGTNEEQPAEVQPEQPELNGTKAPPSTGSNNGGKKKVLWITILVVFVLAAVGLALGLTLGNKDKIQDVSAAEQGGGSSTTTETESPQTETTAPSQEEDEEPGTTAPSATTWPHEESDIPLDPNVRVGMLDNGLRYMIMPHPKPEGKVSFRLRIDAGSLMEDEDQLGLAHFLEHMLFNGLPSFPGNSVIQAMQRMGMDIGPHINAYTSFEETVYKLDTPNNETETLNLCFTVLREWLDGAILDEQAIEDERGVVLAELNGGDVIRLRLAQGLYEMLIPDTLMVDRWPIGTEQSLKTMVPEEFNEFYSEYYTPKRATLVVAGDIDADEMENRITETFKNATNPEIPGKEPDLGSITPGSGFQVGVFTDDQFKYREIYLYTTGGITSEPDNNEKREKDLSYSIACRILTKRFEDIIREENSAISYGNCVMAKLGPAKLPYVTVDAVEGRFTDAIMALEQEFRRFVQFGVTKGEFVEAKAVYLNNYERAVEGADTRESATIAESLSRSINDRTVFSSPEENYAIVAAALEKLTPELVHESFVEVWDTQDISLAYLTKDDFENTTSVLETTYNQSQEIMVEPPMEDGNLTFAYTDFGEPAQIVSDIFVDDLDVQQLVLSNNVRVNLKKTAFTDNSVSVIASFGSGKLSQPQETDFDVFSLYVMNLGGLGNHSTDELSRVFAGKSVGVGFRISDDRFYFTGETEPEHLELQFQLLAAHISDPGYREEAVRIYRQQSTARLNDFKHTLDGPVNEYSQFLKSGDERYGVPLQAEMLSYEAEQVRAWLEDDLLNSYLEVTVVGEFDEEIIVDYIVKTIGALPTRAEAPDHSEYETALEFPRVPDNVQYTYDSKDPQAQAIVSYETLQQTATTINTTRYLNILSRVFRQRLFLEVREELGAAYSPRANSFPSSGFEYGEFRAFTVTSPENVTVVANRIQQIGDSLAQEGVTEDELVRGVEPILSGILDARNTNAYWLTILDNSQAQPHLLDFARTVVPFYSNVSLEDVNVVASTYFGSDKSIVATIIPVDEDGSASGATSVLDAGSRRRHRFLEQKHYILF